ncbi:hypothetical protein GGR56DRAFT_428352 [Xylariaceae sp. FL0804]|nr:hypothetical protein GGR56DRAFT_428352 [Xylariaceae sp. FL0804]
MTIANEQAAELATGIEQTMQLYLRCSIYERLYIDRKTMSNTTIILDSALLALYKEIASFLAAALQFQRASKVKSVIKGTFRPRQFTTKLEALEIKSAWVEMAANNCHREKLYTNMDAYTLKLQDLLDKRLDRVDSRLAEVWTVIQQKQRVKMMQWISPIPYESAYENVKCTRVKGTCEWLIAHDKYVQWRDTGRSTTLWLHGIPGAGKTRLASRVVEDILEKPLSASGLEGLAYFFCDRNQHDYQDPACVLRSLVRQLSFSQEGVMSCTRSKYTERQEKGFALDELTLDECQTLLGELTKRRPRTTIILDGLDECDPKRRAVLIENLVSIVEHSTPAVVKMFIASRDDDDIKNRYACGNNLEIRATDNQKDIDKYVEEKMRVAEWLQERMSPEIRREVLSTFREKSQGM